jgi:hypothetical protein
MRIRIGNSNLEIRKIKVLPGGANPRLDCWKTEAALHSARRQTPHAQNHRPRQPESGSDVYAPAPLEKLATASASVL